MLRRMFKSKIHRATVTEADLNYEGSLTLDPLLLEAADKVNVVVLALREGPAKVTWSELRARGARLQQRLDLPFDHMITSLQQRNVGNARHLFLDPATAD